MAAYRVVCARRESCPKSSDQVHVSAIGTGDPTIYAQTWTATQVIVAIDGGDRFYVEDSQGRHADVKCLLCPGCGTGSYAGIIQFFAEFEP